MHGADEVHPSVQEAYKICEHYFKDDPNGVLNAQDILNKQKTPHLANILETLSISERETISKYCEAHPEASSRDIWLQLEKLGSFDPLKVPTIGRLVEELNRTGDVSQTSLKEYTHFFDVNFLQPL